VQRVDDADELNAVQLAGELGVKTAQMSGADDSEAKHGRVQGFYCPIDVG
jgi:hypothetical protein